MFWNKNFTYIVIYSSDNKFKTSLSLSIQHILIKYYNTNKTKKLNETALKQGNNSRITFTCFWQVYKVGEKVK